MKKIVALMLALVMALSAIPAFAEPTEEAKPMGLVLTSSINVERGAAGELLKALGIDEDARDIVDSVLTVLNTVNDRLTIAPNGVEYSLSLNDVELVNITGGQGDRGFVILSNILPSYALTLSANTLNTMEQVRGFLNELRAGLRQVEQEEMKAQNPSIEEALDSLMRYVQGFIEEAAAAVRLGEPEKGAFEFGEGVSYNTRQPIGIDTKIVDDALNAMITKISRDEKVLALLNWMNISVADLQSLPVVDTHLPAVDMSLYSNTDDSGAELSPDKCISVAITLPEQNAPCATFDLHMWEKSVDAVLSIPGSDENSGVTANFSFAPFDAETAVGGISMAVDAMGSYFAVSGVITPNADGSALTLTDALYILDASKPLAAATTTIAPNDAPLDLSIGKREVIEIESLFVGKQAKKLRKKLNRSLIFSGLSILATATDAVPEVADLITLLTSDSKDAA